MAQLAIKPGMSALLGAGASRDVFGAAARHVQRRGHELVATSIAAIGRIRGRLLESGEHLPGREPGYFETARMSREMYRL